jgi:hypothetical protein
MKKKVTTTTFVKKFSFLLTICLIAVFSTQSHAITDALKIKISKGSYSDETIIRFLPGATTGFDGSYDAWKMFSTNLSVPNIFSKSSTADELSINAIPSFTASVTMDLFLRINAADTYTITAEEPGAFASGVKIIMKDLVTNQLYNLRTINSCIISLPVISQTASARFQVFFSYPASTQISNATCSNCTDGIVSVTKAGEATWDYTVINSSGSNIRSGSASTSTQSISGLASGNYTVAVTGTFSYVDNQAFVIKVTPILLGATFTDFRVAGKEGNASLLWTTGMEANTDYFTIEHSQDGINYEDVLKISAAGNSSETINYSASDNDPYLGCSYYRIRLTDLNGDISYSKISSFFMQSKTFLAYPVPASETLNLVIDGNMNSEVEVILKDLTGRELWRKNLIPVSDHENMAIPIAGRFPTGAYIISVVDRRSTNEQKIIIK